MSGETILETEKKMAGEHQYETLVSWLDDSDLKAAARSVVVNWFTSLERGADEPSCGLDPASFGTLESYVAEAVVVDHGADFLFPKWGAAMSLLCGGDRLGHRLSSFPQPSRSHLRRVCVRAAASKSPTMSRATWALDGQIWRCTMIALPTACDSLSATRLLVALLYAPHPLFADKAAPEGPGWPAAVLRGGAHSILPASAPASSRPISTWKAAASVCAAFWSEARRTEEHPERT